MFETRVFYVPNGLNLILMLHIPNGVNLMLSLQYVRPYIPSSLRIPEYTPPRDLWNWMVLEGGNLLADIPDNCSAAGSYVLNTAKQFVQ